MGDQRTRGRRPEPPPAEDEATELLRQIAEDVSSIRFIVVISAVVTALAVLWAVLEVRL